MKIWIKVENNNNENCWWWGMKYSSFTKLGKVQNSSCKMSFGMFIDPNYLVVNVKKHKIKVCLCIWMSMRESDFDF